jgi:hypothetical protein
VRLIIWTVIISQFPSNQTVHLMDSSIQRPFNSM